MILFVGPFPPPVTGMRASNQAIFDLLSTGGFLVERLNTAPRTLKRDLVSRLSRISFVFGAWGRLFKTRSAHDQVYLTPSAGWGQLYDLVSLAIARIRNLHCIVHHHTFTYLTEKKPLTTLLLLLAGREAVHVLLCDEMDRVFKLRYGARRTLILSNLLFVFDDFYARKKFAMRTIGFLSNITIEKGGETIVDLALAIKNRGLDVNVVVAGPCFDEKLIRRLNQASLLGALEWRGGVYGEEKKKFWKDIDAFVFPSQYEPEADPWVVWEAIAAGLPVIAYDRGCISQQIGGSVCLISKGEAFVPKALCILEKWVSAFSDFQSSARHTQEHYEEMKEKSLHQWNQFLIALSEKKGTRK